MKFMFRFITAAVIVILYSGCSTTSLRIQVETPPQVAIYESKTVVITDFSGNQGSAFTDELTTRFSGLGYYDVLSQDELNKILSRNQISFAELSKNPEAAKSINELKSAVIISGKVVNDSYKESEGFREKKCLIIKNFEPKSVDCYFNYIKGTWRAKIAIDVVSIQSGHSILSRSYSKTKSKELKIEVNKNGQLKRASSRKRNQKALLGMVMGVAAGGDVIKEAMDEVKSAIKEEMRTNKPVANWEPDDYGLIFDSTLSEFMRLLTPNKERITLVLFKDDVLPELEKGIKYAKNKDWRNALQEFKKAVNTAERTPTIENEWKAKAYHNLGVIHGLIGDQYDESNSMINKAILLKPESQFYDSLKAIKKLEQHNRGMKKFRSRINKQAATLHIVVTVV